MFAKLDTVRTHAVSLVSALFFATVMISIATPVMPIA